MSNRRGLVTSPGVSGPWLVSSRQPTGDLAGLAVVLSRSPGLIVPEFRAHLDALGDSSDLVFTSPNGSPMRHSNCYHRVGLPALDAVGMSGTHFHD